MHLLYLDDSGKIHVNDPCKVAVIAGFSVPVGNWHRLVRHISGAKGKLLPSRASGNPNAWEIKSGDFVDQQKWQRAKNRNLCFELVEILKRNNCYVYSVSIDKAKATGDLDANKFVPLMIQRLAARFHDQVRSEGSTGMIVLDWSTHQLDEHVTRCVSSMVATQKLNELIGGVTYGSSHALPPLQVADLIASVMRRDAEGEPHIYDLAEALKSLRFELDGHVDSNGFPVCSVGRVF